MKSNTKNPRSLIIVIGLFLSASLLATISGCSGDLSTPISRVLDAVTQSATPLSDESKIQLARFDKVFNEMSNAPDEKERLDYFRYALKRIETTYVREMEPKDLVDAAIEGVVGGEEAPSPGSMAPVEIVEAALDSMMASLDPHSSYMNPEEFLESFVQITGEFGGLGIEVTLEEGFVKVVAPIEDTPASRAGMISGDLITHVDGENIEGKTLSDAVKLMRGAPGEPILLTVRRKGVDDFDVKIVRAIIKVRSVKWRTEDNIGYIRVTRFTEKVETGIEDAVKSIKDQLGHKLSGVILDLRNNPGGLLDQSLILSDAFLNDGNIVSVKGRHHEQDRVYVASSGDLVKGIPMVVLINGGSASASEIVASALKENGRATIMGTRSFGKGSVQTLLPMPVEGALRMTTALYYSPSGRTIQARGVVPDIIVKPSEAVDYTAEADLPGAISAVGKSEIFDSPIIPEKSCPVEEKIGNDNKEVLDYVLGCAVAFLNSASAEKFITAYGQSSQM